MQILTGDLFGQIMVFAVLAIAVAALVYAYSLARQVLAHDKGTPEMQQIWGDIKAGANAYLTTQFSRLIPAVVGLAVLMFLSVYLVKPTPEAQEMAKVYNADPNVLVGIARMLAFILGASFSAGVGYLGMNMAVEGNVRVASAARRSYHEALQIAYRSGTITGMLTDGLGLLGGTTIFLIFAKASPDVLLGFGFGGTLLALFMRVGGGIFTKAADVGADLVGKVEAGMEEDDPRNAAVIADLVGDNVGDCAGMAADIFESYEVTIVSSFILGLALYHLTGSIHWIVVPLIIRGVGVISTIIGTYAVTFWKTKNAEEAMFKSYELSSVITITAALIISALYGNDIRMGVLVAIGVALAVIINPLTAYATSANSPRVQHISASSKFGPALVILEGISLGYISSVWSVLVIILSLAAAILLYTVELPGLVAGTALLPWAFAAIAVMVVLYMGIVKRRLMDGVFYAMWVMVGGFFLTSMHTVGVASVLPAAVTPGLTDSGVQFSYILFGVSLIGVGMLSLTGNNVSMDAFGPIADNANGIGEVAGLDPQARQIMADLDAAGNTTKAITKGVAIGSAVIAALSLYGAFFSDIERVWPAERGPFSAVINLAQPTVFVGLLIGGMLPLLFGSLLIKAVNRSAAQIMSEVRRQLRIPEIWEGKRRPDYSHAVAISTRSAQAELIPVGVIAVVAPIVVGLLLKEQALGGFLAGVILSGQLQAVFMANAGGAWDNAKKYIEDGYFGGKHSDNHKATVVGDTVGDPFKDTAGPALNPMIKVMNLVSLIMAPIVVQFQGFSGVTVAIIIIGLAAILWAVRRSDRQVDLTEEEGAFQLAAAGGGTVSAAEVSKPAASKASSSRSSKPGGRSPARKRATSNK